VKLGVLLPHYGEHTSRGRIIEGAQLIERLGFDSIWVRDHLLWTPHGMEGNDPTFVDAFMTLAAVGAVTDTIGLGTAVLIPIRWPLKVAQNFASLSYLAGRGIECGFGMGANPLEFAGAGFSVEDRETIFGETVEICQRIWAGDHVAFAGEQFAFDDVTIDPKPVGPMATWYGGSTRASVRRAARWCDGWLPGRLNMPTLDNRLKLVHTLGEERGRTIKTGCIPLFCVDEERDRARSEIDVDAIAHSSEGAKNWVKPSSGEFRTLEDLEGMVLAGDPDDIVAEIGKFQQRGLDTLIIDLRLQFTEFEEKLELISRHVLPRVRATTAV
jgi:alkanesulfonate monooxygenase SsuD/methylene tetrahydromethanopterin reductase-like flavin-dependent oxidoreductase (luciferase family)